MSIFDSRSDRRDARPGRVIPIRVNFGGGVVEFNPVISLLSSGTPNATDATITWTTDIPTTTQVFWGLTTAYTGATSPIINSAMVTSHSQQITGLVTATLYHYMVLSRSLTTGGYAISADGTFTTA
jgi:hypothetical protein